MKDSPISPAKLAKLKSVGHNIADSLASGIGLMIGVYQMDVFAEAESEPEGFVLIDFLVGTTDAHTVSAGCREAINLYRKALPELCSKHEIEIASFTRLEARFGTDPVYGRYFTVTVEGLDGKRSTDRYIGVPGKRMRRAR